MCVGTIKVLYDPMDINTHQCNEIYWHIRKHADYLIASMDPI